MIYETDMICGVLEHSSEKMTEKMFLEAEIARWKNSKERRDMLLGKRYYKGEHDILRRRRTVIGKDGFPTEVFNLPNNKVVDNQYAKMVDQKANYLLGKPLTFDSDNKNFLKYLKNLLGNSFMRTLKYIGEDTIIGGIGWLYPYYDANGNLCFKRFESFEILPFWADAEHTILDMAVRIYSCVSYEGTIRKEIEKAEVYTKEGIKYFDLIGGKLVPKAYTGHMTKNDLPYNWGRVPLIPFKFGNLEIPLIKRVKSLQDGINTMISDFENNMCEDARNTILVIKNLDGTNLAEFRHNLATYGAVKVKTVDGAPGAVETLNVSVNSDNYKAILDIFKKALIENARGFDAKSDIFKGTPNQLNIQSMYADIDLDANSMETEFRASLDEVLWFIKAHLHGNGLGNFESADTDIIFNRDILINESESIENCVKSKGIISDRTIIAQHPWTRDVYAEILNMAGGDVNEV